MLVWLDRATGLRLWRVVRRTVTGLGRTRQDLADNCPEKLSLLPEFINYIWTTRNSARARIAQLVAAAPEGRQVVCLRTDEDVVDFLAQFRGRNAPIP
jgi:hypothetical protein